MSPQIRALTVADLPEVVDVERDAEARFADLDLPLTLPDGPSPHDGLVEAIGDGLAFGIPGPDGLLGILVGSVVGDAAFVEELSVRTAASGQRLGASLIDRLERAAGELGLSEVVLTTFADVPFNAPYYRRLGFEDGAGSRGAALLSAEAVRGFDEEERIAMRRPVRAGDGVLVTEVFETAEADASTLEAVRELMGPAFEGDFSDDDWHHALGGLHVVVREHGAVVAHAAGVPRTLYVGASPRDTGYVEAVAVAPPRQRDGLGTRVMRALTVRLRDRHDLLALSSSSWAFYARLGWVRWQGPTFVRRGDVLEPTPDDDGGILVASGLLPLPPLDGPLGCDARPGDVW